MKHSILAVVVVLLILLNTAVTVQAQRRGGPKFRSSMNYNSRRKAKGVSIFAGAGVAVMNSDNRRDNTPGNEIGTIRNNGIGSSLSIGAMYQVSPALDLLGSIDHVSLKGSEDTQYKAGGDVSYKASGTEISGSAVFNLFSNYKSSGFYRARRQRLVEPYVKVGVGALVYKASSSISGGGEDIIGGPLPAARHYPAVALTIPIGGGLKFYYSKQISIAPEVILHITTTDYLDNRTNSRGYLGPNDLYANFSVKLLYALYRRR